MTRIKISLGILILLVGISVFSGVWVSRSCSQLISRTDSAAGFFHGGGYEQALEAAQLIESEWGHFRAAASVLLDNDKLAEIDRMCARIVYMAENKSPELESELDELRHLLGLLKKGETPAFTSIF